ncbi:MAG: hypothetical protein ACT4TC_01770 [Myxococcaceae bacterium]
MTVFALALVLLASPLKSESSTQRAFKKSLGKAALARRDSGPTDGSVGSLGRASPSATSPRASVSRTRGSEGHGGGSLAIEALNETQRAEANVYFTEGIRLRRAKDYRGALVAFRRSIEADEAFAAPHYALAATLGRLRKQGQVCRYEARKEIIVKELWKAVALEPARLGQLRKDADFEPVRDTVGYQRLLGNPPEDPSRVDKLLEHVSWYAGARGAYGSAMTLDLQEKGRFTLSRRVKVNYMNHPYEEAQHPGRWFSDGRNVVLKFDVPLEGKSEFKGQWLPQGVLRFDAPVGEIYDHPAECDV